MPVNKKAQERLRCLVEMLKKQEYPEYRTFLAKMREKEVSGSFTLTLRTFQRDIEYLRKECGAPIEYNQNKQGYYLTRPYWQGFAPAIHEDQMAAAVIGARLAAAVFPPSSVKRKMEEGAGILWSRNIAAGDDELVLRSLVVQENSGRIPPEIFQVVFTAWQKHHRLELRYRRMEDGSLLSMKAEPHVLALSDHIWYLKIRLVEQRDVPEKSVWLVLAIHRIAEAKMLERTFEPDLKVIQEVNEGRLFSYPLLPEVRLRLRNFSARYAMEYLPIAEKTEKPDGSLEVILRNVQEYRVLNYVLCSGGDAVILAPESLKQKAVERAEQFLKQQQK